MSRSDPVVSRKDLPVDALVLAGRRAGENDPLARVDNVPHKSLLVAGGKPLIRRVIEALFMSKRVDAIRIAAPEDLRTAFEAALAGLDGWSFVPVEGSPAKTVFAALDAASAGRALLVTTSDHALLSGEIVRQFLEEAKKSDVAAGCVAQSVYEARFPKSRRTFIRLKDLRFSGANLFWFSGARAKNLAEFWRRLEAKRKNPAAMAAEIGLLTALSYATGRMTKEALEKTIARKTKVGARLVPLTAAEAAIDVDKPEDLALVRSILALD